MYEKYKKELEKLDSMFAKRTICDIEKVGKYISLNNKQLLNLSSNDYLGLAENKDIINDFLKGANYSLGSASARLLTGTSGEYKKLEDLIAKNFQKEGSLLFNSGYHANVGIMSSLADKHDVIFSDKLNHASIIDGMRLSGADFHRYKHLDYNHLESLLEKHRNKYETAIIISESVFSMDGDIADLNKLVELKEKYNAILIIDEAHAFGVFGETGLGVSEAQGCTDKIDAIVATFGKAIGSMGAFCVSNKTIIDYLTNKARSFIFSTSLPEINIAFSKYIIENILPTTKHAREDMLKAAALLRTGLTNKGIKTAGESQIVPIIIGDNEATINKCKSLQDNGFYALPIRHPTVPKDSARIRLSLRADITFDEIKPIIDII